MILLFKNGGHLSIQARKEPPESKAEARVEGRSQKELERTGLITNEQNVA